MLKLGIGLTYNVVPFMVNDKKTYSIQEAESKVEPLILVCLDREHKNITIEDLEAMADLAPAQIIVSEEAFKDDSTLSNAHYKIVKEREITFKLV
jgi:hypothetical protein